MTEEMYLKSRNYETLIRRAFKCEKGRKHGADAELYLLLVKLESDNNKSTEYLYLLQKLRNYLSKALSKLRRRKRFLKSDESFTGLLIKMNNAKCSNDLAKIVSIALLKIIECENQLIRRVS